MLKPHVLQELAAIVGPERCKTSKEDLLTYAYDAYVHEYLPDAVLFPKSAQEVSRIMKMASANNVFVTPRGAGSGLMAGSLAKAGRDRPLLHHDEPDPGDQHRPTATPSWSRGWSSRNSRKPLEKLNLFYPPDPGSATVATMGGAVVMNAGGMRGVKYGVTRDYVLGLEIVLPSGEVMNTGALTAKDVTGYDLTRLICGSEGTLALVTKIIVRLLPKPKTKRTLQAIYNRIDDAGNTVAKIIEAGIIPATLELMDKMIIKALEDFAHLGLPLDAEALLLMDVDGDPETVEKQAALVADFCKSPGGPGRARLPVGEGERTALGGPAVGLRGGGPDAAHLRDRRCHRARELPDFGDQESHRDLRAETACRLRSWPTPATETFIP